MLIARTALTALITVSVAWALWASPAQAQSEKILVVSGARVPDRLQGAVVDALDNVGSVMDPDGYAGNLRARSQAPDSESALTKLAPQMGASLIVVLQVSRGKLEVTFRDGHTGSVISDETVPARGKKPKLAPPARRKLAAAARRALSKVGPAPSASSASSTSASSVSSSTAQSTRASTERAAIRPSAAARVQPAAPAVAAREEEEEDEEEEEQEEEHEGEAESAEGNASADPVSIVLNAGAGVGMRSILAPTREGGVGIDSAYMPALDVGAAIEIDLGRHWLVRAGGAYRTIFGLTASELLATGAIAESGLSTHSLSLGASLGYLTDGKGSLALHLFLGWAYRGLTPPDGTGLPSVSVAGPAVRPELHIPLGKIATLRIAPEIIIVVDATSKLPLKVSGLESTGFAYGGEASLDFNLGTMVKLGLMFRESRAAVASGWGISAEDNERYLVARLTLTL